MTRRPVCRGISAKMRFVSILLPALFLFIQAGGAAGAGVSRGWVSVEDYYYKDSGSDATQHLFTTRIKLDMTGLNDAGTAGFHFDGRERVNLGDYKSSTENARIDVLNFDYTGQTYYIAAGRLYPKELGIEHVDGVNLVAQGKTLGLGLFGGLRPDTYDEMFTLDYTTLGTYIFLKKETATASLAFVHNGYKGGTDRQYIYGQALYLPVNTITLLSSVTVDIDQETKGFSLTNGILEASYRPDSRKTIGVGFSRFRAYQLFESMDYTMEKGRQQAYYLNGSYRILDRYNVYTRVERQSRNYSSIEEGLRKAYVYRLGLNTDDVGSTGIGANIHAALTDGYGSKHTSYNVELSKYFREVFQLVLNGSYALNKYATDEDTRILGYGVTMYYYLSKKWSFTLAYAGETGGGYDANNLLTKAVFRF